MARYIVGDIIRHWREQAGITVEELAGGKIDPTTLWRIEEGHSMPGKDTLEYLFQSLGLDPNSLTTVFLDNKFAETQMLTDKLDRHLTNRNPNEASKLINELEQKKGFMKNKFNVQYILAAKASLATIEGVNPLDVIKMLEEAFVVTRHNYREDKISTYFLSRVDFNVFNMIAINYSEMGEYKKAIFILQQLLENVKTHFADRIERGRRYPCVIYNLSKDLLILERHDEVIKLCEEGKDVCLETDSLRLLPLIMAHKAFSLLALGERDECLRLLNEVHGTLMLRDKYSSVKKIKDYAAERGIILDW